MIEDWAVEETVTISVPLGGVTSAILGTVGWNYLSANQPWNTVSTGKFASFPTAQLDALVVAQPTGYQITEAFDASGNSVTLSNGDLVVMSSSTSGGNTNLSFNNTFTSKGISLESGQVVTFTVYL